MCKAKKKQTKTDVIKKQTVSSFRLGFKFVNLFEGLRLNENAVETFLLLFFFLITPFVRLFVRWMGSQRLSYNCFEFEHYENIANLKYKTSDGVWFNLRLRTNRSAGAKGGRRCKKSYFRRFLQFTRSVGTARTACVGDCKRKYRKNTYGIRMFGSQTVVLL